MAILILVQLKIKLLIGCNHLAHAKNNDPNVLHLTVVMEIKSMHKLTNLVEITLNKSSRRPAS